MTTQRHVWLATAGPTPEPALRPPDPDDGAAIFTLVRQSPPLDLNTCYAYLLQGLHFRDTCVITRTPGRPAAGYVSGYRPPGRPDTLFIWQVAVAPSARGQGLAQRMLRHLLDRPACRDVRWLETTVTADNTASLRLFHGLARERDCPCTVSPLFPASAFSTGAHHAAEDLLRIGPFVPSATTTGG